MSEQTPAGWYPADEYNERYWDGSAWSDQVRPKAPAAPATGGTTTATAPAVETKKKRRVFLWFFLAIQLLFLIWIIAGVGGSSGSAEDCGTLDQATCDAAEDVGTGLGVALIIGLWMVVDFFLAVIYGIYRLAKRT